jgi:hypothetical protein
MKIEKILPFRKLALSAVVLAFAIPFSSYAATTKITRVNVRFSPNEVDYRGLLEVDANVKDSAHYSAGPVMNAEEYYEMDDTNPYEGQNDVYVVELSTEAGYQFRFSSSDKKKIVLSGMGAEFLKANQEDNGHTLRIFARLQNVDAYVGEIEDALWNGCRGEWDESEHAVGYLLRLADTRGRYHYAETSGTTYDFSPLMLQEGTYNYSVRAMSSDDKYGEWVNAGGHTVTPETAEQNRELYEVRKVNYQVDETLDHTPDNNRVEYLNVGWQISDDGSRWYRNQDGTYPQNSWEQIDGSWYYFNSDGYVLQDSYVEWKDNTYYVGTDGIMLVDGTAPDGRTADENGILANTDSGSNGKNSNGKNSNGKKESG